MQHVIACRTRTRFLITPFFVLVPSQNYLNHYTASTRYPCNPSKVPASYTYTFAALPILLPRRPSTMASEATPRVNAKYLDSFTNQTVRILGKVVSLRGETATIDANGTINVQLNRVSCLSPVRQGEKEGEAGHVENGEAGRGGTSRRTRR